MITKDKLFNFTTFHLRNFIVTVQSKNPSNCPSIRVSLWMHGTGQTPSLSEASKRVLGEYRGETFRSVECSCQPVSLDKSCKLKKKKTRKKKKTGIRVSLAGLFNRLDKGEDSPGDCKPISLALLFF